MSDEERDEYDGPREGESEHEWMQRLTSPELRWLDLFHRLTVRVEGNEEDSKRREERIQRNIEFIVQQQAQFQTKSETDMQNLRAAQAKTDEIVQRLANVTLRNFEGVKGEISNLDRKMEALVDAQIRSEDEMKELRETQKETGERLNAFIDTVGRLINEQGNGGGKRKESSG
jgi:hypothetical protein